MVRGGEGDGQWVFDQAVMDHLMEGDSITILVDGVARNPKTTFAECGCGATCTVTIVPAGAASVVNYKLTDVCVLLLQCRLPNQAVH